MKTKTQNNDHWPAINLVIKKKSLLKRKWNSSVSLHCLHLDMLPTILPNSCTIQMYPTGYTPYMVHICPLHVVERRAETQPTGRLHVHIVLYPFSLDWVCVALWPIWQFWHSELCSHLHCVSHNYTEALCMQAARIKLLPNKCTTSLQKYVKEILTEHLSTKTQFRSPPTKENTNKSKKLMIVIPTSIQISRHHIT